MPNWFVGFPVQAGWIAELCQSIPSEVRIFDPDDVHITMAFLGSIGDDRVGPVVHAMHDICFQPVRFQFDRVTLLPHARRFSAISLSLASGCDEVAELIGRWRGVICAAAGCSEDTRPPFPHATIARPCRKATHSSRQSIRAWSRDADPSWIFGELKELALYTWAKDRDRRQFRVLARRPATLVEP